MVGQEIELVGQGMRVKNTPLFLDATRKTSLSFVSHAHSDHVAAHDRVIGTAATLKLLAHRVGAPKGPLPASFHQPFSLGNLTIELLPAGHVLGSAQIRLVKGGRRIAYTGDLNPVRGLTAEPADIASCDVLVMESTFGHPRYAFPPREETYAAMRTFARRTLDAGRTPVFLAYTLGKAQEAMQALLDGGFPLAAHTSIAEICDLYAELGRPIAHRRFGGEMRPGEVLVWPANLGRSRALDHFPHRTAVCTGWAADPGTRYRYGTDEAFPLSDHADFEGLVAYAKATGARRVLTVHGFTKDLAACLRDRGIDAQPLVAPRQMELF